MIATRPITPSSTPRLPATLKRIVLTGFMGAGKTTAGRLLAETLRWSFLDLDAHLEARTGSSIAELFALHGEAAFRRLESSALAHALGQSGVVLALGGGTPAELTNQLLLEQTPGTAVIFLDAPFEILFDRCMLQSFASPEHVRPVLSSAAAARARFAARVPIYRRLARSIVDTSERDAAETAAEIARQLGSLEDAPRI